MAGIHYHADGADMLSPSTASAVDVRTNRQYAWLILISSVLAGLLLAVVWSFEVADGVLGARLANTALGANANDVPLNPSDLVFGLLFAFAAGLGATFTACNLVVFSCVAPIVGEKQRHLSVVRVLALMVIGVVTVTATYGVAGAMFRHAIPILSTATLPVGSGEGYPVRLAQSSVVFVSLGVIFVVWGLRSLAFIPNPTPNRAQNRVWLKPLALGVLVGLFTVGRPFPLFRRAFEYAADTGNPFFSATAMTVQGLGNIALMMVLVLLLNYGTRGGVQRWMQAHPQAITTITAISMIVGGVFFISYWGLRVPSYFGIGWFPHMPYR